MKWILFVIVVGTKDVAVMTQEFDSLESCKFAEVMVPKMGQGIRTVCLVK